MSKKNTESGFSLLEMIVTVSLGAILTGLAVVSVTGLNNPSRHGAVAIASFLESARSQAISSTGIILVRATNTATVQGYHVQACDDTDPVEDNQLLMVLPNNYGITDITWEVCFSARGFAAESTIIPISDAHGQDRNIQVYIGGGIRVL
jgi:prepilin-type N-terminal cleavage/methylation domain-containing protein